MQHGTPLRYCYIDWQDPAIELTNHIVSHP